MNQKNNTLLIAVIAGLSVFFVVILIVAVLIFAWAIPAYKSKNNQNTTGSTSTVNVAPAKPATAQPQQQATTMYVANVENSIYLRSNPAEDPNNIITTIPVGTQVVLIENTNTVFSKVSYGGTTGYVKRDYLSATKPQKQTTSTSGNTSISKYVYVANVKNSIYLRSSAAEVSSNIITTIPLGTCVGYIERVNSTFSKISYNGTIGYAKTKYLADYNNISISKYVYVANVKDSIYLRSSAAEVSSNIITTIPLGTRVGYIERVNGTFSKISYNGTIGYAKTKYLSDYYSTNDTYLTVYNVKHSIYLRSTPREVKDNIICEIPLGTVVRYLGESSGGFLKISYDGKVGYSKAIYLK